MTNIQFRIAFIWLMIAVCYLLHSNYHLADAMYGIDIKIPETNGTVPVGIHVFES